MLFNELLDVSLKHSQTASWTLLDSACFCWSKFPSYRVWKPYFYGCQKAGVTPKFRNKCEILSKNALMEVDPPFGCGVKIVMMFLWIMSL